MCIPVRSPHREGADSPVAEYALVNNNPSFAIRSIFGVENFF